MRAFFAVYPDEHARGALAEIAPEDDEDLRATDMADWHVTVRFLGELGDEELAAATAAGHAAAERVGHLQLQLGPTTALGAGAHVLFVPATGAEPLAEELDAELAGRFGPRDRPFRGHLTIARARGRRRLGAWRAGVPVRAAFGATELALVGSTLEPARAVHRVLARFPLQGGPST